MVINALSHQYAQAFVTLATTDEYCMGSLVIGKSLRRHGTSRKLVVMVSPSVTREVRLSLEDVFDEVVMVDILESGDRAHLSWLGRPELGVTFTKLHCWTLTQYSKCVFLDADTLVLCNIDELFDYEELSAAPDPGWPDCFNSGVFVFRPSLNTHTQLLEHATQHGSFDGGDQGVLNTFFSDWAVKDIQKHLPFVYNLTASALYTYLPAFHRFGHQAKIVHFLGGTKPWHYPLNAQEANESSLRDSNMNTEKLIHLWWSEYYSQRQTKVLKDDLKEDSSLDYHLEQQLAPSQTPQTPSQSKKSNTEAHHRVEKTPSQPLLDLNLDTLTISSSEKPVGMNILFDVLSGGDPEERSLVVPFFGQESKDTGPETSDDSIATTGEAEPDNIPTETEEENLEHRRMWEEGHIDYMGIDAFDNIERKLDRFLD
ncbi:glycogenin-2 isoform X1 [Myxocyprinus asiaticus]|uniref:glycogenin-2 isoform X1 n=2 Tax=Myxocyprinus asiaticus TaxID=70543 RepID=UPI0022213B84|nr:glycogenin-2 isoform X1 [Myxocyprinus asiaticus]